MTLFEIIVLAIIQGLTEFLPISSSAHLILPAELLGWRDQGLAFDVAVHLGSLLAVIGYFRHDLVALARGWLGQLLGQGSSAQGTLAWYLIFATLPAVVVGFIAKDMIEIYARSSAVIAITTIVFGLLLWYADVKAPQQYELSRMRFKTAMLIGVAQVLALVPGTSRSGITMTAGLLLGLTRQSAARFSFLLSIPIILGAGTLSVLDLVAADAAVDWSALGYGVVFSFISAYLCITLFLRWISRLGMLPFVIYRLLLGVVLLFFLSAH